MKQKEIWLALCVILAAGLGMTHYTRQYGAMELGMAEESAVFSEDSTMETEGARSEAMTRLQELDELLAKKRPLEQDTTNSMKAAVEAERRLWENELLKFLDELENQLPPDEREQLFADQKDWSRLRENTAVAACGRQNSSLQSELEYNRSMKDSARARVYELVQVYSDVLSKEE